MSENAVSTAVAQFTESVTNAFTEYTDAPPAVVTEIEAAGEQLAEQVDTLESSHEITQSSLWELEDIVMGEYDSANPRFKERSIVEQIDEIEATVEDVNPGGDGTKTTVHNTLLAESPLEQVTGLTEHEAIQNLSSNQVRARTIAMNIPAIAKSAEAGFVIDNSTLRSELTKIKGERPNDNDVKRVRDFLSDLGKKHVDIVDHRGSKMVVVEKAYAKQLGRTSYSPEECLVVEHKNNWRDMVELHSSGNGATQASAAV
ncbi:hypothetical protein [Haladaptatus sp. NG-WS-4]